MFENDKMYTQAEVSEILNVDKQLITRHIKENWLKAINIWVWERPVYRIKWETLNEYFQQ